MKYSVDRIEEDIAVLEDINTSKIKEVKTFLLPENIREGNILLYENGIYTIDKSEEDLRRKLIQDKFNRLRDLNTNTKKNK